MPWFMTPFGPHFVVEPGTIDEYERRDYVSLTTQQVTDYYAGVAFPDPPSFATEAEVPGIVATAVAAGTGPVSDALRAAFGAAPAHAGPRLNRFDLARSVYNLRAENTRRARAKLGAAKAGAGLCHIACAGDSLTAGSGASPGVTDYPSVLRALLSSVGYPVAGSGLVPIYNGTTRDPQWTHGGGWSGAAASAPFQSAYSADQDAIFASTATGTVVEIATFGVTTAFDYVIDGGAPISVAPNGQQAVQLITVTDLPDTTHTVTVTSTSGAGTFIIGAGVRRASGVMVSNFGIAGSTSADWTSTSNAWLNPENTLLAARPVDILLLELGINDAGQDVPLATFEERLGLLVSNAQADGTDVFLAASQPSQTSTISEAEWNTYLSRMYAVADDLDVPLLDLTDRFGPYAESNANGVMADVTHLNAAGYADKARAWANVLAA